MNAREQLDGYAATISHEGDYASWTIEEDAPKAFAALRAVLDVVDEMDRTDLFAAYAFRLRTTISTALGAAQ